MILKTLKWDFEQKSKQEKGYSRSIIISSAILTPFAVAIQSFIPWVHPIPTF